MADKILLESGDALLLESGDFLLLEVDTSFCATEPSGGFFWLWEDGSIMALEDCTGGWLLEDQSGFSPADTDQGVLLRPGGITHNRRSKAAKDTRRRRILLENGQIIVPRDDDEYRMIVEQIVAGFEPAAAPAPKRRRRVKGAVVAPPPVPRMAPVSALPGEFYNALEQHRVGVLNYLSIIAAWQAYLAEMDEDEAVTLLLMN